MDTVAGQGGVQIKAPAKYRPEIDGLRAVAVLAVIFCHAQFRLFAGGYVGVDVFYVISGFLITTILRDEIAQGRFSILRFYERRVRRILPALFLVVVATAPFAWWLMLPGEFRDYGQSLVAVNVFLSNVFFLHENGYFEVASDFKPLLHTWSLAVEEQFYVIFPILLFVLSKLGKQRVLPIILLLAVVSLVWSEYAWRTDPKANFFLLPSRAWELLAGSLLALAPFDRVAAAMRRPMAFQGLSLLGLALIVAAVLLFDAATPTPSLMTFAPVLGSVLIIACATRGTWVYALLSTPIARGIGIISYSAYLWHQPVFVFARLYYVQTIPVIAYVGLIFVTLGLAFLSWRLVEVPFRDKKFIGRWPTFAGAAAFAGVFVAFGLLVHVKDGLPQRFTGELAVIGAGERDISPYRDQCSGNLPASLPDYCVFGANRSHIVAVVGDSHSTELFWRTSAQLGQRPYALQELTWNACPPFTGLTRGPVEPCQIFSQRVKAYILARREIDTVVLVSNWPVYFNCVENRHCVTSVDYPNLTSENSDNGPRVAAMSHAMERDIDAYLAAGKKVVLVYPVPEMEWHVPRYMLSEWRRTHSVENASAPLSSHLARAQRALAFLNSEAARPGVATLDPAQLLCANGVCRAQGNGVPLYFDSGHLNGNGADLVAPKLLAVLDAEEAPPPAVQISRLPHELASHGHHA